jgi:predicted ATPase
MIPERLYGREREIEALLASFDRVVANGAPELVLVSGYSGIGKSSVVKELHKALVPARGLFAPGKFDQYKRDIPYATLIQAFQGLVHSLLGQSEAELGLWRVALSEALAPNGQLIVKAAGSAPAFFAIVLVDITERKRAEAELHRKEVSLREAQTELAHVSRVTVF